MIRQNLGGGKGVKCVGNKGIERIRRVWEQKKKAAPRKRCGVLCCPWGMLHGSTLGDHATPGLFDELKDGEKSIEKCSLLSTSKQVEFKIGSTTKLKD